MHQLVIAVAGKEVDAKKVVKDLQSVANPKDVLVAYYHDISKDKIDDFNIVVVQMTTEEQLQYTSYGFGTILMTETSKLKDVFSQCIQQYIFKLEAIQTRMKNMLSHLDGGFGRI